MINLDTKNTDLLKYLAYENKPSYNFNKALEECIEFQEVLIKLQTKPKDSEKRPPEAQLIEEFGDAIYRGLVVIMTTFPDTDIQTLVDQVEERIDYKLGRLQSHKSAGDYKGGL